MWKAVSYFEIKA